jgi:hypothetical protein
VAELSELRQSALLAAWGKNVSNNYDRANKLSVKNDRKVSFMLLENTRILIRIRALGQ